ncbi:hypothetical protein FQN54_002437 [Arachnomyces sp. PD_36]|nr:hypothetical protein FQN54_002437 [Arachnomyces sp. PD_36]
MASDQERQIVPPKTVNTDYPLIDSDPHVNRVFGYARSSDYAVGAATAAVSPGLFWIFERMHPSHAGKGAFPPVMRLATAIGVAAGFFTVYQRSTLRFYGFRENTREVEMDMREMVDKAKRGEPLYGKSSLSPYMQGVATRNSRYAETIISVIPWFNFVNHNQHGVDTAKYYQQAERELEAERLKNAGS